MLMNQRANSVADLAAVLLQAEAGPPKERIEHKERSKRYWANVKKQKEQAGKEVPKRSPHLATESSGVEGVRILWADLLDGEFAETWPSQVAHGTLERHRYTAAFPAYEMKGLEPPQDPEAPLEAPEATQGAVTAAPASTA